jgi:hypothetical protein
MYPNAEINRARLDQESESFLRFVLSVFLIQNRTQEASVLPLKEVASSCGTYQVTIVSNATYHARMNIKDVAQRFVPTVRPQMATPKAWPSFASRTKLVMWLLYTYIALTMVDTVEKQVSATKPPPSDLIACSPSVHTRNKDGRMNNTTLRSHSTQARHRTMPSLRMYLCAERLIPGPKLVKQSRSGAR